MGQNIKGTYARTARLFKEITADELGQPVDSITRKRVPKLVKPHPNTGQPITIKWEPEEGEIFANEAGLFAFPSILDEIDNVFVLPNIGLEFNTATLAYIPKTPGTALDRTMLRMRFDFERNNAASASIGEERVIRNILFGTKDSGKAIDRMELEQKLRTLKLRKSLRSFQNSHKADLRSYPELQRLTPRQIRVGALTALSRTAFFAIHWMPELEIGVDYQFSLDYCRNTPATIQKNGNIFISGTRLEAEGEAFGTYAVRRLSDEERALAIKTSLNMLWGKIRHRIAKRGIETIATQMNKAEYARKQVAETYGLDTARNDNVKASDYMQQPLRKRLTAVFEGDPMQDLLAMPTPAELRRYSGLRELEQRLEAA